MVDGGYPDGCYITVVNISYFEFRAYEQVSCFVTVLLCVASVTALTPGRAPENGGRNKIRAWARGAHDFQFCASGGRLDHRGCADGCSGDVSCSPN